MQSRQPADLLIEARWVLPIAPRNLALADHAVAIVAGRVAALGPAAALRESFEPREHVQRHDHVLMPGLVDALTQPANVLLRGLAHEPCPPAAIADGAREPAAHSPSADLVRDGARIAIAQMLKAGITSFAGVGAHPRELARAATAAHMRAAIGLPVADAPSTRAAAASVQLAEAESLWDEYRASPWVSLYFAPEAPSCMSEATLARVRTIADELDARIAMPLRCAQAGCDLERPLRRLAALGLLRPGFVALELTHADGADLELAARTGIAAVACPQADLRRGRGVAALHELIGHGVPFALGSGDAQNGALDLLAEARTAALLGAVPPTAPLIGPAAALRLATLGGAGVLGLAAEIGSIEPGKAADLIAIDLGALSCQSGTQPAESVLFSATREHVSDVWLSGSPVVARGRLISFDAEELEALKERWQAELSPPWSPARLAAGAAERSESRP